MSTLRLAVPAQDLVTYNKDLDLKPKALEKWLETIPLANVEESGQQVLAMLRNYNRCQLEPAVRFQVMTLLRPVIAQLAATLENRYLAGVVSHGAQESQRNHIIQSDTKHLFKEAAYGYKIIINDTVGIGKNYTLAPKVLINSIFEAMMYLSRFVLSAYLSYVPEPQGVWGELNRLYNFAEQMGVHKQYAAHQNGQEDGDTIDHMYKRIALLALGNPYQLMPGEAQTVFNCLDRWVTNCNVEHAVNDTPFKGTLYVDLAHEEPPRFMVSEMTNASDSGRIFEIEGLLSEITTLVRNVSKQSCFEQQATTIALKERIQRDMLLRLQQVWGGRLDRKNARYSQQLQILLTAGLNDSHHFISAEAPFEPEWDEVKYYRPDTIKPRSTFSLVPLEYEPWKTDDVETKLQTGVVQVRTSQFDIALNIWEKIYATKIKVRTSIDAIGIDYTAQIWQQTNESFGGIGLLRAQGMGAPVRVGDIVAFKQGIFGDEEWSIGTVRWQRANQREALEVGIMTIAQSTQPIAVRAIGGVGKGGEYFRALLITGADDRPDTNSIIVPANIFDSGTRLVANQKTKLFYVRLLRVIETTSFFTQFEYKIIPLPDSERRNIEALREA